MFRQTLSYRAASRRLPPSSWLPSLGSGGDAARRIHRLEGFLAARPYDHRRQVALLRELNRVDPSKTLRCFEAHEHSMRENEDAVKEYIKALVYTKHFDHSNLSALVRDCVDVGAEDRRGVRAASSRTSDDDESNLSEEEDQDRFQRSETRSVRESIIAAWRRAQKDSRGALPAGEESDSGEQQGSVTRKKQSNSNSTPMTFRLKEPVSVVLKADPRSRGPGMIRWLASALLTVTCMGFMLDAWKKDMEDQTKFSATTPVESTGVTLKDVKGCDEVMEEVEEIVRYLKDPGNYQKLGAKLPRGVLLAGPPGVGKTLIAKAIAGECGVPFFSAAGSDFEEMFVGVGSARIRSLFASAKEHAPCIVFIDEIDALASKRTAQMNSTARMSINQLLAELDGFDSKEGVVVMCASNTPRSLDPALLRAGRLDRQIHMRAPDLKGRKELIELYAGKIRVAPDFDIEALAKQTPGFTGADIRNLLNTAAVRAATLGRPEVGNDLIEAALDRNRVGLEKKNPMTPQESWMTAIHEGGHALIHLRGRGQLRLHKVTIKPRGQALGLTWGVPLEERFSTKRSEYEADIEVLLGGKAAEEIFFGKDGVTSGCSNDLSRATSLARYMVVQSGMVGPDVPLISDDKQFDRLSDEQKGRVNSEAQKILQECWTRTYDYLKAHESDLRLVAEALVEFETLTREEVDLAMSGRKDMITQRRKEASEALARRIADERERHRDDDPDGNKGGGHSHEGKPKKRQPKLPPGGNNPLPSPVTP